MASEAVQGAVKKASRRPAVDDLASWKRKVIGPSVSVWLLACPCTVLASRGCVFARALSAALVMVLSDFTVGCWTVAGAVLDDGLRADGGA